MFLCLTILTFAMAYDISDGRIPALLSSSAVLISQLFCILSTGSVTIALMRLLMGFGLMILLFPLFSFGCIGGGDIKLIMMLPSFVGWRMSLYAVAWAFVTGAVIGGAKLVSSGLLMKRLRFFAHYLHEVNESGRLKVYDRPSAVGTEKIASHQIYFTLPLLIGTLIVYGGF